MKTALASLILTLVAYAQACCAEDFNVSLYKTQSALSNQEVSTMQPTWLFGDKGSPQIMGFTQVITTQHHNLRQSTTHKTVGFGLHQQITPFMYTQFLLSDEDRGKSAVKVGIDF